MAEWKVILVDDEPDSLNLVADILILNGVEVYRASGGSQCVELLDTVAPTLVILDLAMPKPDGWDLLNTIRSRSSTANVPVVAITAYYSDKVSEQAYQAGFNAFIPKPIRAGSFLTTLRKVVAENGAG